MTARLVSGAVEKHHAKHGTYDVSVWSFPELYGEEIVRVVRALNDGDLPHKKMQTSTAGAIRALGCEVLRTEPQKHGHYSVRFRSAPADEGIQGLLQAFNGPRRTPSLGGG